LGVVTDFDFAVTSVKSESRSKVSGFISTTEVCCGGGRRAVVVADGAGDVKGEVEGRVDGIGRGREGGRVEEAREDERAEEGGEGGSALTCATRIVAAAASCCNSLTKLRNSAQKGILIGMEEGGNISKML
jgi:hypothetical protein